MTSIAELIAKAKESIKKPDPALKQYIEPELEPKLTPEEQDEIAQMDKAIKAFKRRKASLTDICKEFGTDYRRTHYRLNKLKLPDTREYLKGSRSTIAHRVNCSLRLEPKVSGWLLNKKRNTTYAAILSKMVTDEYNKTYSRKKG